MFSLTNVSITFTNFPLNRFSAYICHKNTWNIHCSEQSLYLFSRKELISLILQLVIIHKWLMLGGWSPRLKINSWQIGLRTGPQCHSFCLGYIFNIVYFLVNAKMYIQNRFCPYRYQIYIGGPLKTVHGASCGKKTKHRSGSISISVFLGYLSVRIVNSPIYYKLQ